MYGIIFLSYLGLIFGFLFLTICIACGLYYLSEFIEEYAEFSKKLLKKQIYFIIFLHFILLVFDRFPFFFIMFSILSHISYLSNLDTFPYILVSSFKFIISSIFTILNHLLWIWHFRSYFALLFANLFTSLNTKNSQDLNFSQIISFFAICVWLAPFSIFISLSAGDCILPTSNNYPQGGAYTNFTQNDKYKRIGLIKSLFSKIKIYMSINLRNINWNNRISKTHPYI